MRVLLPSLVCGLLASTLAVNGVADEEGGWHEHASAYEQAREAVEHGRALSLPQVRAALQRQFPGRIVDTHYEFEFDRWVYQFKVIDPHGALHKVHLDARTGQLVQVADY